VTIYDIDPANLDQNDTAALTARLARPDYTIKRRPIVARQGEIVACPRQKVLLRPYVDEDLEKICSGTSRTGSSTTRLALPTIQCGQVSEKSGWPYRSTSLWKQ